MAFGRKKHWPPAHIASVEKAPEALETETAELRASLLDTQRPNARPADIAQALPIVTNFIPEYEKHFRDFRARVHKNRVVPEAVRDSFYNSDQYNEAHALLLKVKRAKAILETLDSEGKTEISWATIKEMRDPVISLADALSTSWEREIQDARAGATHAETKETLRKSTEEIEALTAKRADEREAKAEQFAQMYGITEAREKMLEAEKTYAAAVKELHKHARTIGRKIPEDVQNGYDQARLAWREALGKAADSARTQGDKHDVIAARFIGIRDTAVREEKVRQDAIREAWDEKKDRLAVKAFTRGTLGAGIAARKIGQGVNWLSTELGADFANMHKFVYETAGLDVDRKTGEERKFDKEKWTRRYARASRILGGAAIATALTGGFAGYGLPFVVRAIRGTASLISGTYFGAAAGSWYDRNKRHALIDTLYDKRAIGLKDIDALRKEEKLYQKGTAKAREAARRKIEIGTAMAVGGTFSIGTGLEIGHHPFEQLSAVKKAAHTLTEQIPEDAVPTETVTTNSSSMYNISGTPGGEYGIEPKELSSSQSLTGTHDSVPTVVPEGTAATVSIENASGKGTDQMFSELKAVAGKPGFGGGTQSEALKHLLATPPNELSQEMGEAYGTRGMMTHPGDKFLIDDKQNVFYQAAGEKPQPFITNDGTESKGFKIHAIEAKLLPPIAAEAPEASAQQPAAAAPSQQAIEEPARPEGAAAAVSDGPAAAEAASAVEPPGAVSEEPIAANSALAEAPPASVVPATQEPVAAVEKPPVASVVEPRASIAPPPAQEPVAPADAIQPEPPSVEAPAGAEAGLEPYTNGQGTPIDPRIPQAYTYADRPGHTVTFLFGGSNEDRFAAAQEFLEKHPNSTIRLEIEETDLVTGVKTSVVVEWSSDENGTPIMQQPDTFVGDNALPKPTPELFTRKLDFTYHKQT